MIRTNAHALNFLSSSPHERVIQFVMTPIQCPRCGREAAGTSGVWGEKKPYCTACGWNVDRANVLGGKNQKALALWFVIIAVFLSIVGASAGGASKIHPVSFIAFGFVLLLLALISWRRSKSQKPAQTVSAPASAVSSVPTRTSSEAVAEFERLRMVSRPRTIRMKRPIRIFVIVYAFILGSVGYGIYLAATRGGRQAGFPSSFPNVVPLAVFALIWGVIAIVMFRSIVRHRSLLIDGEIAMGTITSQTYAGGENRGSNIVYEFKDAAGRTYTGKGSDPHSTLFEEMQTPVFYDSTNPGKNVALATAAYNLIDL
jgi:ribosomal protein L37E